MSERPPSMEVPQIKTRTLAEDAPRAWEGARIHTVEDVIAAVHRWVPNAGDLKVTEQVLSHDGVLLEFYMRASGSDVGYQYVIKNANKNAFSRTVILKIDYMGPDSEDVYYAEELTSVKEGLTLEEIDKKYPKQLPEIDPTETE